jgi:tetratricopeptide (TPR) repeat protein
MEGTTVVRLCPRKRAVGSELLRRGPRPTTAIVADGGACRAGRATPIEVVYTNRHRYADAERLLKRSMAVTEKAFGPDHPDVAQALNNLAAVYVRQGHNADAERLFKRSVVTFEKTLGPNHPDLAGILENLAGLYKDQGRYPDAIALFKRSMTIRAKAGSPT